MEALSCQTFKYLIDFGFQCIESRFEVIKATNEYFMVKMKSIKLLSDRFELYVKLTRDVVC